MEKTLSKTLSFDDFELDAERRLLLKRGAPLALNPKAFDLLLTLIENHGRTLSKDELLETVWENQFVEENNLSVHITALRKILGDKENALAALEKAVDKKDEATSLMKVEPYFDNLHSEPRFQALLLRLNLEPE